MKPTFHQLHLRIYVVLFAALKLVSDSDNQGPNIVGILSHDRPITSTVYTVSQKTSHLWLAIILTYTIRL